MVKVILHIMSALERKGERDRGGAREERREGEWREIAVTEKKKKKIQIRLDK